MTITIKPVPVYTETNLCRLYFWADNDYAPVEEALIILYKNRTDAVAKFYKLFNRMSQYGKIVNNEQFKAIKGYKDIYEFKVHGVRIYCFFDGRDKLILAELDYKKSDKSSKTNINAIQRADNRRQQYFDNKV